MRLVFAIVMSKMTTVFFILHEGYLAIFWKMNIKLVTSDKFMETLMSVTSNSLSFPGFSLAIFDLTDGQKV